MRIAFITLLSALLATGYTFGEGKKFTINGTMPDLQQGRIFVIVPRVAGRDTLARADVSDGKFTAEGTLQEPVVALLTVEKFEGGFEFMLDTDAPYDMVLKQKGESTIRGGKMQSTLLEHQQIIKNANQDIRVLREEEQKAVEERRFKTASEIRNKAAARNEKAKKELEEIESRNKDNIFAAYIQTAKLSQIKDVNELKQKYAELSEAVKATEQGKMIAAKIAGLEQLEVAAQAPDFTLTTPEGKEMSLYGIKGKLKIIDFWASWCGPCRLENPNMVKLYQDYKDKGLTVISVSLDEKKEPWVKAIEKDGMPWIHLSDLKGWQSEIVKKYGVDAVPFILVLDENNRILGKQMRSEKLRDFVAGHLD